MTFRTVALATSAAFLASVAASSAVLFTRDAYFQKTTVGELTIIPKYYDFGRIAPGTNVERTFRVCNTGSAAVHVTETIASCGCTSVDLKHERLEPGESTAMKVIFDSKGIIGDVSKQIMLRTDQPGVPLALASLKGNVYEGGSRADSQLLELGVVHKGFVGERTIHLFNTKDSDIHLVDGPDIHLSLTDSPGASVVSRAVAVHIGPLSDDSGEWTKTAHIDLKNGTSIPITVRYRLAPLLRAEPSFMPMDFLGGHASVRLVMADGSSPDVVSASCKHGLLDVAVFKAENGESSLVIAPHPGLTNDTPQHDVVIVQYHARKETALETLSVPIFNRADH